MWFAGDTMGRDRDSDFFEAGGMVGQATGSINALLGSQTPVANRPLNKLMPDPEVFQCPSDIGDPLPKAAGSEDPDAGSAAVDGPYYLSHGSSYIFASHSEDPMFVNDPIPTYGVGSLRNKFSSRMKRPGKKIVFSEPTFSPEVRMSSGLAQWHDKNRNHSNVLFGDTSVKKIFALPEEKSADPAKKDDPWYGSDSKPDPSFPYY